MKASFRLRREFCIVMLAFPPVYLTSKTFSDSDHPSLDHQSPILRDQNLTTFFYHSSHRSVNLQTTFCRLRHLAPIPAARAPNDARDSPQLIIDLFAKSGTPCRPLPLHAPLKPFIGFIGSKEVRATDTRTLHYNEDCRDSKSRFLL